MRWTTNAPIRATSTHESKAGCSDTALLLFVLALVVLGWVIEAGWI